MEFTATLLETTTSLSTLFPKYQPSEGLLKLTINMLSHSELTKVLLCNFSNYFVHRNEIFKIHVR